MVDVRPGARYPHSFSLSEFIMLKSQLILRLAEKMPHVPVRVVNDGVNHLIQLMSNALSEHQRIEIRGFGSFSIKHRPPRAAHNPKTGEKVLTVEKCVPHFKPGKELKDRVNLSREIHMIREEQEEF